MPAPLSIGIIGFGKFGALLDLLAKRFLPAAEVRIHSSRFAPDGERFFSLADAAACDVVIITSSIRDFEKILLSTLPHMKKDSILVDVATVKVHTAQLLQKYASHQPYICTHPMFGPESYEKQEGNIEGFRIAVTEHSLSEEGYASALQALRSTGFMVMEMTPEQHDELLAETLFLTHFIGQTVVRGGFKRTDIDTVSFGFLMHAVESVRHDTSLFQDVFRFNPFCKDVLARFGKAEKEVTDLLEREERAS